MEEEGGDDTAGDARDHVAQLDGADVVEEGRGPAAVTHHAGLDLAGSSPSIIFSSPHQSVSTETGHRIKQEKNSKPLHMSYWETQGTVRA